MYSNQSWPPVISPLGVHPCFRNATRAKQGCCRDWQGHTVFVSILGREIQFPDVLRVQLNLKQRLLRCEDGNGIL